jgi:hypothetical protein
MMKTYSHVRRKALDAAAAVLEPVTVLAPEPANSQEMGHREEEVTSQVASQPTDIEKEACEFVMGIGSSGWIRTSNPPVNSRMLCR